MGAYVFITIESILIVFFSIIVDRRIRKYIVILGCLLMLVCTLWYDNYMKSVIAISANDVEYSANSVE